MRKAAMTTGIACFLAIASANAEGAGDWCEGHVNDVRAGGSRIAGTEIYSLTFSKKFKMASTLLFGLDPDVIYNIRYGYDRNTFCAHTKPNDKVWGGEKPIIIIVPHDDDKSSEWAYAVRKREDSNFAGICGPDSGLEQPGEVEKCLVGLGQKIGNINPKEVFVVETRRPDHGGGY